jgi:hypothetical protein
MRGLVLAASAIAAFFAAQSVTQRADAALLGNPAALSGAMEDIALVDTVHCRRWRHHRPTRWRNANGCARSGAVIVVPGRTRYVTRDGVRVRVGVGSNVRSGSRTTIRTNTRTTVRSGSKAGTRSGGDVNVNVQSGKKGGATGGAEKGGGSSSPAKTGPMQKAPAASGDQK